MRKELVVKTKTLVGVSDLTIAAPIRPGLVPSLDSVTYKSRVKAVLKVLNSSRSSSHEYSLLRTFSDSVERVGQIHSVRIAVIDDKVMLAATFDGNFESYIRVLYRKVGTLLDLVFCNTVGHVGSHGCRYEQWRDWVSSVLVETDMFYSTPGLSFDDVQYLQRNERLYRDQGGAADLQATQLAVCPAEERGANAAASPPPYPPSALPGGPKQRPLGNLENVRQGMQALSILYRLADWYLPGSDDGDYLQRAAQDLLLEMRVLDTKKLIDKDDPGMKPVRMRFAKQLAWFEGAPARQPLPDPAAPLEPPSFDAADVQGGILRGYPGDITHGALVLLRLDGAAGAAALLAWLLRPRRLWLESQGSMADASRPLVTVAFTVEGLRAAGLTDAEIERFPPEFVEGMEARCSVLGDVHLNHPRRWRLPRRNRGAVADRGLTIEMAAVHAVVQLRVADQTASEFEDVDAQKYPLRKAVEAIEGLGAAVQVLCVQTMRRASGPSAPGKPSSEHFGFADPVSNPRFLPDPKTGSFPPFTYYRNQVPLGEALLGHANQADAAPVVADPLLRNGSFLVVRKISQDVARFEQVAKAAEKPGLSAEDVKERLMGRKLDGRPLDGLPVGAHDSNDFNFVADPTGEKCPLQAHVRRVNPRGGRHGKAEPGERAPLIVRRGMSYGPPYDRSNDAAPVNAEPRGLVFMAYNASIAEQFEVLQRWLTGGNSSGISSSQSDPIVGVPHLAEPQLGKLPVGDERVMRFNHQGAPCRVSLDDQYTGTGRPDVPGPITRLEWGLYLFTPSVTALAALKQRADTAKATAKADAKAAATAAAPRPAPWNAGQGEKLLADLMARAACLPPAEAALLWKAALEDPEERRLHRSACVWAAIRECHGGVLHTHTPYGVLVADPDLVMRVFADDDRHYTMAGQLARMRDGFGEIYLGLDREPSTHGCEYERLSAATNEAIQQLDAAASFEAARGLTTLWLGRMVQGTIDQTRAYGLPTWELNLDVKEVVDSVLAGLCDLWFGLPGNLPGNPASNTPFARGGYRWDWVEADPPLIPGHLTWPSRQIFQPLPGDAVTAYGTRYGQALRRAALAFVAQHRNATPPTPPAAPLSRAIFKAFPLRSEDDLAARTLVGALMGFLPTVDGNLRGSLNEWLRDGTFWRLRQVLGTATPVNYQAALDTIGPALKEAMQLRPTPELVWRTALKGHALGGVAVGAGERVVIAIVSATQRRLEQRKADVSAVFGGVRKPSAAPWGPGMPTHACPAMEPGMAVLLGMLAGLLQASGTLRPSPAPLSLTFEGMV